jgi:hypothetical protein
MSLHMSEHTLAKNHTNANFVITVLQKKVTSLAMNERTQVKNHTNANFVTTGLQENATLLGINAHMTTCPY